MSLEKIKYTPIRVRSQISDHSEIEDDQSKVDAVLGEPEREGEQRTTKHTCKKDPTCMKSVQSQYCPRLDAGQYSLWNAKQCTFTFIRQLNRRLKYSGLQ